MPSNCGFTAKYSTPPRSGRSPSAHSTSAATRCCPTALRGGEENPALGWRAIRLGLDRPGLLRTQIRALLDAAAGRELRIMFPMVTTVDEFDQAKAFVEKELTHLRRHGHTLPERVHVGVMVEVPALLYQLDELLTRVDFLSVGSNDLMQFMFAADRSNSRLANRFDPVSPPLLRALKVIVDKARAASKAGDPVRRARLAADRRAGADRDRLPLAVDLGLGGRPGQGDGARSRCHQGRRRDAAAS